MPSRPTISLADASAIKTAARLGVPTRRLHEHTSATEAEVARWLKSDEGAEVVREARAQAEKSVLASLHKSMQEGSVAAATALRAQLVEATPRPVMDKRAHLEHQIDVLMRAQAQAFDAGSWQAFAATSRALNKARADYDQHMADTARDMAELDEDELRAEMELAAENMAEQHLEIFAAEYERRFGQRLRLVT